jgi:hypothetical protein
MQYITSTHSNLVYHLPFPIQQPQPSTSCLIHVPPSTSLYHTITTPLILTSRTLTSLKLIQIPPTDINAPTILIHALPKVSNLRLTRTSATATLRIVRLLMLLREIRRLSWFGSGRGAAAGKETANGVADGRADRDTAGVC